MGVPTAKNGLSRRELKHFNGALWSVPISYMKIPDEEDLDLAGLVTL